ncbi:MAG: hypothetical protein K2L38_03940, partial [Dysosmobacter sp.]|nr:hypothetical protein [Dysosmobacter sp.]
CNSVQERFSLTFRELSQRNWQCLTAQGPPPPGASGSPSGRPAFLLKLTIDFIPLKLYSTKALKPFSHLTRGELSMDACGFSLQSFYFRFTKVRYAGRFGRGTGQSG